MYTWGYIVDSALHKMSMDKNDAVHRGVVDKFVYLANEVITQVCSAVKPKESFAQFVIHESDIGHIMSMPDDFISFGDDVCTVVSCGTAREAHDDDFITRGYKSLIFLKEGIYHISYNERWYTFKTSEDTNNCIDVPNDILDCIPSYIAAECMKDDDLVRASEYRNEYEILLARIDDTSPHTNGTFKVGGDW